MPEGLQQSFRRLVFMCVDENPHAYRSDLCVFPRLIEPGEEIRLSIQPAFSDRRFLRTISFSALNTSPGVLIKSAAVGYHLVIENIPASRLLGQPLPLCPEDLFEAMCFVLWLVNNGSEPAAFHGEVLCEVVRYG